MKRDPEWEALLREALNTEEPNAELEERVLERVRRQSGDNPAQVKRSAQPVWTTRWVAWSVAATTMVASALWVYGAYPTQERNSTEQTDAHESLRTGQAHMLSHGVRILPRMGTSAYVADAQTVKLNVGTVLVHVPPKSKGSFQVDAGETRVSVTGTVFGVSISDSGASVVTVWEGSVELARRGGVHRLSAGESYPPDVPELYLSPRDLELLDATQRVSLPLITATPSVTQQLPQALPRSTALNSAQAGGSLPSSWHSQYAEARRLEATGARSQAAALYEQVATGSGTEREAALFAAGRIHYGLGNHRRADELLRTHRRRFPTGTYARAVDVLLLRVVVAQGDVKGILHESELFLSRFPTDPRAAQFRLARARVWAEQGHCTRVASELAYLPEHTHELRKLCP